MTNERSKTKRLSATKLLAGITAGGFLSLLPTAVARAQVDLGMDFAANFGLPSSDVRTLIGSVIRSLLGVAGFVMVLLVIFSGFKYMTHGGNEDARDEAIGGIKNAVIGLLIMMVSFSAARFIIDAVVDATSTL
ncbi:MAG: hypothetical protein ABIJ46_01400 [bacterium]